MNLISVPVTEIFKSVYDPFVQTIKALINLPDDAENLKGKIDRVESIVRDINEQLQRHGRNPLPLVKDWLHRKDELIQSATGALKVYEEIQKKRCCCCCYWCSLRIAISASSSIRKSLTDIDELLKRKESDFPDGELGEIPKALVQPVESELVGAFIHEKLSELETWLIEDDNVRVIGVYGMPGVGKTTVLKEINNNEKVTSFFKFVIWVTVSRDYDIRALQSRMCERLELTLPTNCSIDEGAAFLHTVLKARSLLLILDDVWTPFDVAKLGVTPNQSGDAKVKILLSTRSKSLCDKMKADETIAMKELTEDDGWELFSKGVFGRHNVAVMDKEVEELARSIARECKGHPLALKTVAQTVPKKLEAKELEFILNQLKAVNLNFFRTHEELITDLFKPLKYSYDALPTDKLKICFLYLAAFREDVEIDAQELIEIWRAEGLVSDNDEGRHSFLKILDDRCLAEIETREEKGVEICKVKIHDVLRDMAVQIGENDENSIFRVGNSLKSFPNCVTTQLRRVSVMHNQIRSLPEKFDCSKLLSLFLGWNQSLAEVPKSFLEKLSLLKALDLSNTAIKSLPSSIGQLKDLVYLRLSNTQIEVLPDEVCFLTSLQLLDLSFSSLTDLPSGISELKRLRILHLTRCKRLKFVSSRISELTCLEELDMWEASFAFSGQANGAETENRMSTSREASLQDVCNLHGLKRLQVSIKSPIVQGLMGSLGEVRDLGLLWNVGVHQADLPSDMKELRELERLHLRNCDMSGTPDLFSTYKNLKYLKLNCCRRLQNLGGLGLGKLPKLRELEIEECRELKELGAEFGKEGNFPRLSILKLRKLPSLDGLFGDRVEARALCSLQSLGIFRCKNLKRLPSGLDSVKSPLEIRGSAEWWNGIEWQEQGTKERLQSKYVESMTN